MVDILLTTKVRDALQTPPLFEETPKIVYLFPVRVLNQMRNKPEDLMEPIDQIYDFDGQFYVST